MPQLRILDLSIIVLYLLGMIGLGYYLGRRQKDLRDYFLSDRGVPWWALSLSIVATETSTVTFISIPGFAFARDFRFMQLVIGYLIGRVIITVFLIPLYFKGELFTVYQILDEKFGAAVKRIAASLFLITRSTSDGFRLFAAAVVVAALTGWSDASAILLMGVVMIIFTFLGGIAAVIWTDVIQLFIYLLGAIVAAVIMLDGIPGGLDAVLATGAAAGKFNWWNFSFSLSETYTFWAGVIGGAFLTTSTHGTDQFMVQRYLCARSPRQAAAALLMSGAVVFVQFLLFLFIGVMLFTFFQTHPLSPGISQSPDRIFPHFIVTNLPPGLVGLVVAAILAAALSSSLSSAASTSLVDFYRPLRPGRGEQHYMWISRWLTVVWGIVQIAVGLIAIRLSKSIVNEVLGIASFTNGPILGVFFLGSIKRLVSPASAMTGLITGIATVLCLRAFSTVVWQWWVLFGAAATFLAGLAADRILGKGGES